MTTYELKCYFIVPAINFFLKTNPINSHRSSNFTLRRNDVIGYRFSHVFRGITVKSNNVTYEPRAITMY
jgi:hypothetical protein